MAISNLVLTSSQVLSVYKDFFSKALLQIKLCPDLLRHWCLDDKLVEQFWYKKAYHCTTPTSGILAINKTLRLVCTETLKVRFDRRLDALRQLSTLQLDIESLRLSLHVKLAVRLNFVLSVNLSDGIEN